jgi:hypothetical protein
LHSLSFSLILVTSQRSQEAHQAAQTSRFICHKDTWYAKYTQLVSRTQIERLAWQVTSLSLAFAYQHNDVHGDLSLYRPCVSATIDDAPSSTPDSTCPARPSTHDHVLSREAGRSYSRSMLGRWPSGYHQRTRLLGNLARMGAAKRRPSQILLGA